MTGDAVWNSPGLRRAPLGNGSIPKPFEKMTVGSCTRPGVTLAFSQVCSPAAGQSVPPQGHVPWPCHGLAKLSPAVIVFSFAF